MARVTDPPATCNFASHYLSRDTPRLSPLVQPMCNAHRQAELTAEDLLKIRAHRDSGTDIWSRDLALLNGAAKFELEVMDPVELRAMVTGVMDRVLDQAQLDQIAADEQAEREMLADRFSQLASELDDDENDEDEESGGAKGALAAAERAAGGPGSVPQEIAMALQGHRDTLLEAWHEASGAECAYLRSIAHETGRQQRGTREAPGGSSEDRGPAGG